MKSFIKRLYLSYYFRHFINSVVPSFGSRAMTAYALYLNAYFHTSSLSSVYTVIRRFCNNNKFWFYFILIYNILPAKAVAVFFLNSSRNKHCNIVRYKVKILHNFCAVYRTYNASKLVGSSSATYFCFCFITFIRVKFPV